MKNALPISLAALSIALLSACQSEGDAADNAASAPVIAQSQGANEGHAKAIADLLITQDGEVAYSNSVVTGTADLNGDGMDEVLAYAMGPSYCGTGGCNLWVFATENAADGAIQYAPLGKITVAQLPIGVFATKTNGYADLAVTVRGGGGSEGVAAVPFDGKAYAGNPTVSPAELRTGPVSPVLTEDDMNGNAVFKIEAPAAAAVE